MILVQKEIKKVYLGTTQVYPSVSPWWQPWPNTVAYYPLDSTNTVNDLSGNGKNMTNNWMSFGINAGADCGNAQTWYLSRSSCIFTGTWAFTLNFWAYRNYDSGTYENAIMIWQWGGNASLWAGVYNDKVYTFWWNGDHNSGYTMNVGKWYNIVVTRTSNTGTIYVDGVSRWSGSVSFNPTSWTTIIWGGFGWPASRPWFMSQLIMENVCWTAQEVSDYFDLTKWNYWIS
jgi:hypothetical protein